MLSFLAIPVLPAQNWIQIINDIREKRRILINEYTAYYDHWNRNWLNEDKLG